MSAATATSIDVIFVHLLGEGVDVWRPVRATSLGGSLYRLDEAAVPDDEHWEFQPGDVVAAREEDRDGARVRVAVAPSPNRARRAG